MNPQNLRCCALVTRYADARVLESVALLHAHLFAQGIATIVLADDGAACNPAAAAHQPSQRSEPEAVDETTLADRADLVIAIGGDGTLLYAAGLVAEHGTPLLGINRGRLGFLTDVLPDDMLATVDAALAGQCQIDQRTLLSAQLRSGERQLRGLALNDVVLQKSDSSRLLDFETAVNGRYVNTHGGDGLIIASATGSTAYALSCGGPIIEPQLDVLLVTPICPHTLSDRPLVVSGRSEITVGLVDRPDSRALISCDGRTLGELLPGDALTVVQSGFKATLLHPPGYDYYRLLRSKLHWGRRSFDAPS